MFAVLERGGSDNLRVWREVWRGVAEEVEEEARETTFSPKEVVTTSPYFNS